VKSTEPDGIRRKFANPVRHASRIGVRAMDSAAAPTSAPLPGMFEDGFGKRRHVSDPAGGGTLEVLCLRDFSVDIRPRR